MALWSMLSNICSTGSPKAFSMAALLASHLCTGALSCSSDSTRQKLCNTTMPPCQTHTHTHTHTTPPHTHTHPCTPAHCWFLRHLPDMETCFCCPQTFLRLDSHYRVIYVFGTSLDVAGLKRASVPCAAQMAFLMTALLALHLYTEALQCSSDRHQQNAFLAAD